MNPPGVLQDPPPPSLEQSLYAALYTPDRFYQTNNPWGVPPLPPHRWPLTVHGVHHGQPLRNHRFPLPDIVGGSSNRVRLADVRCIPLIKAVGLHTSRTGRTNIATVIEEMAPNDPHFPRLHTIRRSDHLWRNLRNYGYMDSGHGWRTTGGRNPPLPSVLPLPHAQQVVNAIHGLWTWHEGRCTRPDMIAVENETAVQDEVQEQLIKPLQLLLQTRYPKNIRYYIYQHLPIFWNQLNFNLQATPNVVQSIANDPPGNFPRWGRPTILTNLGRNTHKRSSAGYSDHVLYFGGNKDCIGALVEVKNFWAYDSRALTALCQPDTVFNGIFHQGPHIPPGSNLFFWNQTGVSTDVVKQIWGELIYNGSRFAAWTNGKNVIIFARTGHTELTVTTHLLHNWHNWDDPDVLATLFGMCCAGVDMKLLGDHGLMNMLVGNTY
ncbi:hypothetical protein GG344DRAFT_80406 [Lentinula edodes]|nr:hypothetical protein GG344DRAFT_80406 [Lentinula edodes]